ncbi:MAG: spore germination protein GerW family protein [Methanoregulaceae archaeon]
MTKEELLKTTVDELDRLLSTKKIVGEPMIFEDRMVIPVSEFGFGFGAGGGGSEKCNGEGSGAGGGISPVALLIVTTGVKGAEGVQVISLRRRSAVAEVVSTVSEQLAPQVISAVTSAAMKKKE